MSVGLIHGPSASRYMRSSGSNTSETIISSSAPVRSTSARKPARTVSTLPTTLTENGAAIAHERASMSPVPKSIPASTPSTPASPRNDRLALAAEQNHRDEDRRDSYSLTEA